VLYVKDVMIENQLEKFGNSAQRVLLLPVLRSYNKMEMEMDGWNGDGHLEMLAGFV
jgi:hypothetical protein